MHVPYVSKAEYTCANNNIHQTVLCQAPRSCSAIQELETPQTPRLCSILHVKVDAARRGAIERSFKAAVIEVSYQEIGWPEQARHVRRLSLGLTSNRPRNCSDRVDPYFRYSIKVTYERYEKKGRPTSVWMCEQAVLWIAVLVPIAKHVASSKDRYLRRIILAHFRPNPFLTLS